MMTEQRKVLDSISRNKKNGKMQDEEGTEKEENLYAAGFFARNDSTTDEDSVYSTDDSIDVSSPGCATTSKITKLVLNDQGLELVFEESLGQELGCRLWTAALMLCGHLRQQQRDASTENSLFLRNKRVLEIGAGLGACGFVAAANGAAHISIGECGPKSVARLLQTCQTFQNAIPPYTDSNVSICRHLWEEDLEYLTAIEEGRTMETIWHWSKHGQDVTVPALDYDAKFDIVLGSDLLYFSSQEQPLLAALRLHLSYNSNSMAVILQTMRTNNVSVFGRFVESARAYFDIQVLDVSPEDLCGTFYHKSFANETPHTTGYKLLTLRRGNNHSP